MSVDDSEEKLSQVPSKESLAPGLESAVNRDVVLRKLDWHLLPIVSILYLLCFLDRANIGNAKIAGLTTDLGLTGLQFNLATALFYIPYCALEVPCNMALKRFSPSRWLPLIMVCWSIVMISMAFVKSFGGLMAARIFLGVTESGLFPGIGFYLCLWYPRDSQAQRLSIFIAASSAAGAFGGILAYAIEHMDGIRGLDGWSWIFILEGMLTTIVALISAMCMENYPETATFLTEEERTWLVQTLRQDTKASSKEMKRKFLMQALRNPHAYLLAATDFFIVVPLLAYAVFVPTIIVGLGYSSLHAQLLTIPPSICGCVVSVIVGIASDRLGMRGPFVLVCSLFGLTGYVMLYATTVPVVGYIGTLLAASGLFAASACVLAWTSGNSGGDLKRGAMIGLVTGMGNTGAIVSSFIYQSQDSPRYHPGHATNIGCCCVVAILSIIAMLEFARRNREKRLYCEKEGITMNRIEEFSELGDRSPLYRYTL